MIKYKVTLLIRKVKVDAEGNEYLQMPIMGGEDLTFYSIFTLEHDWINTLPAWAVQKMIMSEIESGLPELVGLMKVDAGHE